MSATITIIGDVAGTTFRGKIKKYVDTSTYYVMDGARSTALSGGVQFVIDPNLYFLPQPPTPTPVQPPPLPGGWITNPSQWTLMYASLIDGVFS